MTTPECTNSPRTWRWFRRWISSPLSWMILHLGQIAAANALSDVYAMGGRPISALSIVGFPNKEEGIEILEVILRGGLAKMQEAGCA